MNRNRHKIFALEILIEWATLNQEDDFLSEVVNEIGNEIESGMSAPEEKNIVNYKRKYFHDQYITNEESLFVDHNFVPQCILNGELKLFDDKLMVLITILEKISDTEYSDRLLHTLANSFGFKEDFISRLDHFIGCQELKGDENDMFCLYPEGIQTNDELEGDWIESNKPVQAHIPQITSNKIDNKLFVLFLQHNKLFLIKPFNKDHKETITILKVDEIYTSSTLKKIDFSELKNIFNRRFIGNNFALISKDVSIKLRNREVLSSINFIANPGELIGIAGNEGSGKSTLLETLAGVNTSHKGGVYLNSFDITKHKYQLSGLIGYVPDNDLLFSNLTAFENIDYTFKLSKYDAKNNSEFIDELFERLGLSSIRNTIVGKTEDKKLLPYQRRLLNIARELVRDPKILIIDNSKSGLSYSDASKVIDAITPLTYDGKIVITSISETNPNVFKNFDKLLILCNSGDQAYYGNRKDAINSICKLLPEGVSYKYKKKTQVTSEVISKLIDHLSQEKKRLSNSVNQNILEEQLDFAKKTLPVIQTRLPRLEKQYYYYTLRNFKTKIAKQKELLFSIVSAPLISLILSVVLRDHANEEYYLSENPNLPLYFFMSIIISVFLGVSQSIGELISDRRLLEREESINLSFFSYINAKITYLLVIILLQSFMYTLIGNGVLEIRNMLLYHWGVYFSSGAAGVMLGLIFSAIHKSYHTAVVKILPITMLLLLLLGGGIVPFENYQKPQKAYPPLISEAIISRWAYEAIMVKQFTSNAYNKEFYEFDRTINNGAYYIYNIIPEIEDLTESLISNKGIQKESEYSSVIYNQLIEIQMLENIFPFEYTDSLKTKITNPKILSELEEYILYLEYYFRNTYNQAFKGKNRIIDSLNSSNGIQYVSELQRKHDNKSIRALTTKGNQQEPYILYQGKIIPKTSIIFQNSSNNFGRAAFFSSQKRFNNQRIGTYEFNLSVIWIINLLVYVVLISNTPSLIIKKIHS